jgi:hypothetical protein
LVLNWGAARSLNRPDADLSGGYAFNVALGRRIFDTGDAGPPTSMLARADW